MSLRTIRQNHFGLYHGSLFFLGAIIIALTFIIPIKMVEFQGHLTTLIPYSDKPAEFEKISFIMDSSIYLISAVVLIWILYSNKFQQENKEKALLSFFLIHFFFASGTICWLQQYLKYKDFVGGEGQDIFPMHVAIIEASLFFLIFGYLYDRQMRKKLPITSD